MSDWQTFLTELADLLTECRVSAEAISGWRTGVIGNHGHSDGIRVGMLDLWLCPIHPHGHWLREREREDGSGGNVVRHADGKPIPARLDEEQAAKCLCALDTAHTVVTGWVRVLVEETPGLTLDDVQARSGGSTAGLVGWLAGHADAVAELDAEDVMRTDLGHVHAAAVRALNVVEPDRLLVLHAWLPVHQALAVAAVEAPGRVVSRATAYRLAEWRQGARCVQPARLLIAAATRPGHDA